MTAVKLRDVRIYVHHYVWKYNSCLVIINTNQTLFIFTDIVVPKRNLLQWCNETATGYQVYQYQNTEANGQ